MGGNLSIVTVKCEHHFHSINEALLPDSLELGEVAASGRVLS